VLSQPANNHRSDQLRNKVQNPQTYAASELCSSDTAHTFEQVSPNQAGWQLLKCSPVPFVPRDLQVDILHTESEGLSQEHLQVVLKEEEVGDSSPTLEHSGEECKYALGTETKIIIKLCLLVSYINSLHN
jgi:hypothetical protein